MTKEEKVEELLANEELLEKYLENGELSDEDIDTIIRVLSSLKKNEK